MPRAKQHFLLAAAAGVTANAMKQLAQRQLDPSREWDWVELGVWGGIGGVIGVVPDLIEPAVHPNHRGFFHSVAFGALAWYATHAAHTKQWDPETRAAARMACWCYLSHLLADALTPKSIRAV